MFVLMKIFLSFLEGKLFIASVINRNETIDISHEFNFGKA